MPTGYTANIYDNKNVTFKDFVLTCARAFGACMHQRDDPMSDKPKIIEPDIKYYLDNLERAKKFKKPSKTDFKKYISEQKKYYNEQLQKSKDLKNRYNKMIDDVKKWNPPTSEHQGLKDFMIQQLTDSIKFDCSDEFYNRELKSIESITYDEYVKEQVKSNAETIVYNKERMEKEIQNTKKVNKWITDLYDSLS